jgi:homogentisate 1,2-dioxygenase
MAEQAHVGIPEGTFEKEHRRRGSYGKSAHLYHSHPPTDWIRFEGKHRPQHFDLNLAHCADLTDPRGVTYRVVPETADNFFLVLESKSEFEPPEKGLLGQHARFDMGVVVTP